MKYLFLKSKSVHTNTMTTFYLEIKHVLFMIRHNYFFGRVIFFFVCMVFSNTFVHAQFTAYDHKAYIPPSPESAAFGKYGETPVGHYSGVPQVEIPLYTIQVGDFSMPIGLSYHGSGFKAKEEASWVGLGWTLNAGGRITRTVRDADDFLANGFYRNYQHLPDDPEFQTTCPTTCSPSDRSDGLYTFEGAESYRDRDCAEGCSDPLIDGRETLLIKDGVARDYQEELRAVEINGQDWASDLYYLNYPFGNDRFVIHSRTGTPTSLTKSGYDISHHRVFDSDTRPRYWKVISPNGTQYVFGKTRNTREWSRSGVNSSSSSFPVDETSYETGKVLTTWLLDKIITLDGEEILFEYDFTDEAIRSLPDYIEGTTSSNCVQLSPPDRTTYHSYESHYLRRIVFPGGKVEFSREEREDLVNAERISQMAIYNAHDQLINHFVFDNEDYFEAQAGAFQGYFNKLTSSIQEQFEVANGKKLKLNRVIEQGNVDNQFNYKVHTFEYNEDHIPYKTTYDIDHWGYYNRGRNTEFTPKLPTFTTILGAADREPHFEYLYGGMLEKVTYPTGGFTEYSFEPNELEGFTSFNEVEVRHFGEVRRTDHSFIPETTNGFTEVSGNSLGYFFDFTIAHPEGLAGNLAVKLKTSYTQANCPPTDDRCTTTPPESIYPGYFGLGDIVSHSFSEDERLKEWNLVLAPDDYQIRFNYGVPITAKFLEHSVFYASYEYFTTRIDTELIPRGAGLRIQSIVDDDGQGTRRTRAFKYKNPRIPREPIHYETWYWCGLLDPGTLTQHLPHYETFENPIYPLGGTGATPVMGYDEVEEWDGAHAENGKTIYTFENSVREIAEGFPMAYDYSFVPFFESGKNGNLNQKKVQKRVGDEFVTLTHEINRYANAAQDNRVQELVWNFLKISHNGTSDNYTGFWFPTNIYWNYLEEKETITYDEHGNTGIHTIVNYTYEDHLPKYVKTQTLHNSIGQEIRDEFNYAGDFSDHSFGSNLLRTANAPGIEIQRFRYKDGQQIGEVSQQYEQINQLPLLSSVREDKASSGNYMDYTFHRYEGNRPVEISGPDGVHTALIWGYDERVVIARIENATYDDVDHLRAQLELFSKNDDDHCQSGQSCDEEVLRQALNQLRTLLPSSLVTTYTYDPLVGITSITDPNGVITYYNYDNYNRLHQVTDTDGNLVNQYEYNYQIR